MWISSERWRCSGDGNSFKWIAFWFGSGVSADVGGSRTSYVWEQDARPRGTAAAMP